MYSRVYHNGTSVVGGGLVGSDKNKGFTPQRSNIEGELRCKKFFLKKMVLRRCQKMAMTSVYRLIYIPIINIYSTMHSCPRTPLRIRINQINQFSSMEII